MAAPAGAAAAAKIGSAALSFGAGAFNSHAATKARRANRRRMNISVERMYDQERALSGQEYDTLLQRFGLVQRGYDEARGEIFRLGRSAKQTIRDDGMARRSAIEADSISRGLSSSSTPVQFGNYSDAYTARGVAGVDENLAGMHANLLERRTQASSDALLDLARHFGLRFQRQSGIEGIRASYYGGRDFAAAPAPDLGGLASGFADLFDYLGLFGGGAPGGGGIPTPSSNVFMMS